MLNTQKFQRLFWHAFDSFFYHFSKTFIVFTCLLCLSKNYIYFFNKQEEYGENIVEQRNSKGFDNNKVSQTEHDEAVSDDISNGRVTEKESK